MAGPMISYAQLYEDVLLNRAFGHKPTGFYIDVGAAHPFNLSVTAHFYGNGWRGINIEPVPQLHQDLVAHRPRDVNLNIAVGDRAEQRIIYEIVDSGLSTLDAAQAQALLQQNPARRLRERTVPVRTLAEVCAEHVTGDIDFMKIDVEGWEGPALRGANLRRWRPAVILVEATKPNTQIESHQEWEGLVLAAGYRFVYFDGLNRWYVAQEQAELARHFRMPANGFDRFLPRHMADAFQQLDRLKRENAELKAELARLRRDG